MNDGFIIKELKKGNTKVFTMVYQIYPMIEIHILKNNGSRADAQDTFHNALIVFHEKIQQPNFKLESKISTYIFGVCKNIWLKHLRNQSKKQTSPIKNHNITQKTNTTMTYICDFFLQRNTN